MLMVSFSVFKYAFLCNCVCYLQWPFVYVCLKTPAPLLCPHEIQLHVHAVYGVSARTDVILSVLAVVLTGILTEVLFVC